MTVKRSVEEYSFDTVAVCAKILIKEMTEMEEKETVTQRERLEQQLRFIVEADKVKNIFRQTYLADGQ